MRLRGSDGSTLIEMMIVVAILGIVTVAGLDGGSKLRAHSIIALQRERALQVLEYEAAGAATGRKVDAAATSALLRQLPGARYESRASSGVRRLTVTWQSPRGEMKRELFVLERAR